MNERIASFPSTTLYGNNLISSPTVAQHTLLDLPTISDKGEDARDVLDSTVVFFDTAGCEFFERTESDESSSGLGSKGLGEGSKRNENEAQVVFKWANQLVRQPDNMPTLTLDPDVDKKSGIVWSPT